MAFSTLCSIPYRYLFNYSGGDILMHNVYIIALSLEYILSNTLKNHTRDEAAI